MRSIGIDGCKKGWFTVVLTDEDWSTKIYSTITEVWNDNKYNGNIIIDIPIGMRNTCTFERRCDLEARKLLGPGRGSSVFPVPCRAAAYAVTYEDAHIINKDKTNRGLSKQTWGIIPKIREVDSLISMNKDAKIQIKESHPEIAFWALNNRKALLNNKKCEDGRIERMDVLMKFDKRSKEIYNSSLKKYLRKDVSKDDILDAICMAITGRLAINHNYKTLPQIMEIDEKNIEMKIVYFEAST